MEEEIFCRDEVTNHNLSIQSILNSSKTNRLINNLIETGRLANERLKFLHTLLDTVPYPIFAQDNEQGFIECNKAFEILTGFSKEHIIGKSCSEIYTINDALFFEQKKKEVFINKENTKFEYTLNFNNTLINMKVDFIPILQKKSEISGIVGIFDDITRFIDNETILKALSITDELSGLYNRRGFKDLASRELKDCIRNKLNFSLLMIDIDFFKLYNDQYGHIMGDQAIQLVSSILKKSCCRPRDIVARFGGEEFIIFLPDTDTLGASCVAKKIQNEIERINIPHEKVDIKRVSLSIGIFNVVPDNTVTIENVIISADKLLYTAKQKGRNRIECNL